MICCWENVYINENSIYLVTDSSAIAIEDVNLTIESLISSVSSLLFTLELRYEPNTLRYIDVIPHHCWRFLYSPFPYALAHWPSFLFALRSLDCTSAWIYQILFFVVSSIKAIFFLYKACALFQLYNGINYYNYVDNVPCTGSLNSCKAINYIILTTHSLTFCYEWLCL